MPRPEVNLSNSSSPEAVESFLIILDGHLTLFDCCWRHDKSPSEKSLITPMNGADCSHIVDIVVVAAVVMILMLHLLLVELLLTLMLLLLLS